ncbi:MAG: translation initiation factor [Saprospiraceae bacterium]|nr:translation initiation factor [Saprospiraceae bacterium]
METKKPTTLDWDSFRSLGNPENAPEEPVEKVTSKHLSSALRVFIEKKHRGGKEAIIIKGFDGPEEELESLGKLIKQKCGVGGSVKDGEIIIQGNHREKIMTILTGLGYKNAKKAGG